MITFEGIADAADQTRRWLILNDADLPAHIAARMDALTSTGTSPVALVCTFVEAVYANQDEFSAEAKELAAAAAVVCETFGFHGMAEDHRGSRINKLLTGGSLTEANTPVPKAELQPTPEPEEPPAEE